MRKITLLILFILLIAGCTFHDLFPITPDTEGDRTEETYDELITVPESGSISDYFPGGIDGVKMNGTRYELYMGGSLYVSVEEGGATAAGKGITLEAANGVMLFTKVNTPPLRFRLK